MSTMNEAFEAALLADAAYVDIPNLPPEGLSGARLIEALTDKPRLTQAQAEYIAEHYDLVAFEGAGAGGFQAVVFRDKRIADGEPGRYVLAIRGTEERADILADAQLTFFNKAFTQSAAMYQFIDRLRAPESEGGYELFTGTTQFDVTGHSLGGHLVQRLAAEHPDWINRAYTFNGPGLGGNLAFRGLARTSVLRAAWAMFGSPPSSITNIISEPGIELVSSVLTGARLGLTREIFIEDQSSIPPWFVANNHYVGPQVDALAVYRAFEALHVSSEIAIADIGRMLRAASNENFASLETAIGWLGELFPGNGISAEIAIGDREALHATAINVTAAVLQQLPGTYALTRLLDMSADTLLNRAIGDDAAGRATRYALTNGVPFSVDGADYQPLTADARYEAGALSVNYWRDRASYFKLLMARNIDDLGGTANSDGELEFEVDGATYVYVDRSTSTRLMPEDSATSPLVVFGSVNDDLGADALDGGDFDDSIYGDSGGDQLNGNGGDDYLDGGLGDDTLVGGTGRDRLDGGDGADAYIFVSDSSGGSIKDSDGEGSVSVQRTDSSFYVLGSSPIREIFASPDHYRDEEGNRYFLNGDDLIVTLGDGRNITIEDYQTMSGPRLGLTLEEPETPLPPTGTVTYNVGAPNQIVDYDDTAPDAQINAIGFYDSNVWGSAAVYFHRRDEEIINVTAAIVNPDLGQNAYAVTQGGMGNSYITGDDGINIISDDNELHFDDAIHSYLWPGGGLGLLPVEPNLALGIWGPNYAMAAEMGNDTIHVGGGDDRVYTSGGDDIVYGGDGSDYLIDTHSGAEARFDQSYTYNGVTGQGVTYFYSWSSTEWVNQPGHTSNDQLFGEGGDDYIYAHGGEQVMDGGEGNDQLIAGAGDDFLSGGIGDDLLAGDIHLTQSPLEPGLAIASDTVDYGNDVLDGGIGNDSLHGGGGDDSLLGGDGDDLLDGDLNAFSELPADPVAIHGNDAIFGGAGSDTVHGGGGNDIVDAGADNDTVHAGSGDDIVFGGTGVDTLIGDDATGLQGEDELHGGDQADTINGGGGDDALFGDAGVDVLFGGSGNDLLEGGTDDDILQGDAGNDILRGGSGQDQLQGGEGHDTLEANGGGDLLTGGAGNDTYILRVGAGQVEIDDTVGNNTLSFGPGVASADIQIRMQGGRVFIDFSDSDYAVMDAATFDALVTIPFADVPDEPLTLDDLRHRFTPPEIADGSLQLLSGVAVTEVSYATQNQDLILTYGGSVTDWINTDTLYTRNVQFDLGPGTVYGFPEGTRALVLINWYRAAPDSYVRELLDAASGTADVFAEGSSLTRRFIGTDVGDVLDGTDGADVLFGGAGSDILESGDSDDYLSGGTDGDLLVGGAGDDTYAITREDGQDLIVDTEGSADALLFAADVNASDVILTETAAGLHVQVGPETDNSSVLILNQVQAGGQAQPIEFFQFGDGTVWNGGEIDDHITGNRTPQLAAPIANQFAHPGRQFSFAVPAGTWIDPNVGNQLTYTATLQNGAPLPSWLQFDGATGLFSGVRPYDDLTPLNVRVVAADPGGAFSADDFIISLGENQQFGTSGSDAFTGTSGDDVIAVRGGDDSAIGGDGADQLFGEAGEDTLYGDAGDDELSGGAGADTLIGGAGDDRYVFGSGDGAEVLQDDSGAQDVVQFEPGIDTLDLALTEDGADLLVQVSGPLSGDSLRISGWVTDETARLEGFEFEDGTSWDAADIDQRITGNRAPQLAGDLPDQVTEVGQVFTLPIPPDLFTDPNPSDVLTYNVSLPDGGPLPDWLEFDSVTGVLSGSPSVEDTGTLSLRVRATDPSGLAAITEFDLRVPEVVVLTGTEDSDTLTATTDDEYLIYGFGANDDLTGAGGNDVLEGGDGYDRLKGGAGNDVLEGGEHGDVLDSGDGDDRLVGGRGGDQLIGGGGNDVFVYELGDGGDIITGRDASGSVDAIEFGAGIDSENIDVQRLSTYDLHFYLRDSLTGDLDDIVIVRDGFHPSIGRETLDEVRFADGTIWTREDLYDQYLAGTDGDDLLRGFDNRDDTIIGNGGDDTLRGESGDDDLSGGTGDDELLGGSGNDDFSGGTGNDEHLGDSGNDTYRFGRGQGQDEISDTSGSDRLILDPGIAPTDVTLYRISSETDIVGVTDSSDALVLALDTGEEVWVSNSFDAQTAPAINEIHFADGTVWDETVINAVLIDQSGVANTVAGAAGDDSYVVDHRDDFIDEAVGGGTDTVTSSINRTLLPNVENLTLVGPLNLAGTGNELDNVIVGSAAANILDGQEGIDTMAGGAGNDTYYVDTHTFGVWLGGGFKNFLDVVGEQVDDGYDTIVADDVYSAALPDNVESLVVSGILNVNVSYSLTDDVRRKFTGNDLDNLIDARSADDVGFGVGVDFIGGGAGAEIVINGGAGADTMMGDDLRTRYIVDNVNDVIIAGKGHDRAVSTVSYVLPFGVEWLHLAGSAAISGTGNAGKNRLDGSLNTAANVLMGGAGDDTYVVGTGDIVQEIAGEGTDIVESGISFTLSGDVENLTLTGSASIDGTGNGMDNVLTGNDGANTLTGGDGNDVLDGGLGVDTLAGGPRDVLRGGTGDDRFENSLGATHYLYDSGDGHDLISDGGHFHTTFPEEIIVVDRFEFVEGSGIGLNELQVARIGDNLVLTVSSTDSVTFEGWFVSDDNKIEEFITYDDLGNQIVSSAGDVEFLIDAVNNATVLGNPMPDQLATEGEALNISVPADTFSDPDADDILRYEGRLADGTALPAWLSFDAATRTFTGMPPNNSNGTLEIEVTAIDNGGLSVSDSFALTIGDVNLIPMLNNAIADAAVTENLPFSLTLPADTFSDPDTGDVLVYSAERSGGGALPTWLIFDTATQTFSGTPPDGSSGAVDLVVTATDPDGLSVSDTFTLSISDPNLAPTLDNPLADTDATEGNPFNFAIPTDTFSDPDAGDSLTLSASLADGTPLPAWLNFDAVTGTFTGTPPNNSDGPLEIEVTATDGGGLSISDSFALTIADANSAPVVVNPLADASGTEGSAFSLTVPTDTFTDPDIGDTLIYSGQLSGGGELPSWLTFDAATRTFSGTPPNGRSGAVDLVVTATDQDGLSVSDTFTLSISDANQAPALGVPLSDTDATEGSPYSLTIPAGTFSDPDAGDTLTLGASLADGTSLPSWLTFNSTTRTFTGTAPNNSNGTLEIEVTATDGGGLSATDNFVVTIADTNFTPTLDNLLADVVATEGQAFSLTLPAETFADSDVGDDLLHEATLSDGAALPSWLAFNSTSQTFTGTPPNNSNGTLEIEVTATDDGGLSVSDSFSLTIADTNFAPVVVNPLADASVTEGSPLSLTVPTDTFADPDIGDTLLYSGQLSGGGELPSWLTFDAATRTFSGTPPSGSSGAVALAVTATDQDGLSVSDTFTLTVSDANQAPVLGIPLSDTDATEGSPYSLTIPAGTFSDPDAGGGLSLSANLADGTSLPSWLTFDAAARTFTGTPPNNSNGTLEIEVTATDGGGLSATDSFVVTIADTNFAPTLDDLLADVVATEGQAFSLTLPAETFADSDVGDDLLHEATLSDGAALPSWLTFNSTTQTFTGTPPNNSNGALEIEVTATDGGGLSVSDSFTLTIGETNFAPTLDNAIADVTATEGQEFTLTIPADAFSDPDEGDALTYEARLAGGAVLPSWLNFDAESRTFTGTPPNNSNGSLEIEMTATDGGGLLTTDNFVITIADTNFAPTLVNPLTDAVATEDQTFSLTLPAETFADSDVGDALLHEATLSDGAALPSWLTFNSTTRTFTGTPPNNSNGTLEIEVTATDGGGLSVSDGFYLTIADTNFAPVAVNPLADANVTEGSPLSLTVPTDTFTDPDTGDTLLYSSQLSGGGELPSWLTFDAVAGTFTGTPPNNSNGALEIEVTATDGGGLPVSDSFSLTIADTNFVPTLDNAIADVNATEGQEFTLTVPTDAFTDPDIGDTLLYSGQLSGGGELPAWLAFDAATRTFSGTPPSGSSGTVDLVVTATDQDGLSISDTFTLSISDANQAPVLGIPLSDSDATEGSPYSLTIPAGTFSDPDTGDTLTLGASLADGTSLPEWLIFDAVAGTFTGTPPNNSNGTLEIEVTAADTGGLSVSDSFVLTIADVNFSPTLDNAIPDAAATEGQPFTLTLPVDTFSDPDIGDTLDYDAELSGGDELPAWITFDAATRTLSGTPPNGSSGALDLVVTATDADGLSVSDTFTLSISDNNLAPTLDVPLADADATEGSLFSRAIPAGTFSDPDAGDSLALSASLGDGASLPAWLTFDAATGTFTGTPPNNSNGTLEIEVMATDGGGSSASDSFLLEIADSNFGPTLISPLPDVAVSQNSPFSVMTPVTTFADPDTGDALTLSVQAQPFFGAIFELLDPGGAVIPYDDSGALPGWLSFDPVSGVLSGTAPSVFGSSPPLEISISATDSDGLFVSDTFTLAIVREGSNVITGTPGTDSLNGSANADALLADGGADIVHGECGDDEIFAGSGNDSVYGGDDDDTIFGYEGNDELNGEDGFDAIYGGTGNDILVGGDGMDGLFGGAGDDTLFGGAGYDFLVAVAGSDSVFGGDGGDLMFGAAGYHTFSGNDGADTYEILFGGPTPSMITINNYSTDLEPDELEIAAISNESELPLALEFNQLEDDLIITNGSSSDSILVQDWFVDPTYQIDFVTVSGPDDTVDTDDIVLTAADINALVAGGATQNQNSSVVSGYAFAAASLSDTEVAGFWYADSGIASPAMTDIPSVQFGSNARLPISEVDAGEIDRVMDRFIAYISAFKGPRESGIETLFETQALDDVQPRLSIPSV